MVKEINLAGSVVSNLKISGKYFGWDPILWKYLWIESNDLEMLRRMESLKISVRYI